MSQTERLYRLKSLLDSGRCLTPERLRAELGSSPATLKRDIAHLRDRMNAPVVFDRLRCGYRLDASQALTGTQYELPGLWLSADEIHALLTMQHLLANLDAGGLLGNGLRSFAVDAIRSAQVLERPAIDVADAELDAVLGAGYGIFAGREVRWASLRFSATRARWVVDETWHPQQRGQPGRRAAAATRYGRQQGRVPRLQRRLAQDRGPAARHGRPLPAQVLRRPAPTHSHRPRLGAGAQPDHLRRADPGPGGQRAHRRHRRQTGKVWRDGWVE